MGAPASGQSGPGGPGLTPPSSVRPPRAAGGAARAGPAWLGRVGHATTHSARAPSGRRTTITHTPPISRSSHTPPAAHVQVGADGPARCYCCSAPGQPRACTAVWVPDRTTSAGGGPSVGQVLRSHLTRTRPGRPVGCATRTRTAARAPDPGPYCGLCHVIRCLRSRSSVPLCAGPTGLEIPSYPASGVNPIFVAAMRAIFSQSREYYRILFSSLINYCFILHATLSAFALFTSPVAWRGFRPSLSQASRWCWRGHVE